MQPHNHAGDCTNAAPAASQSTTSPNTPDTPTAQPPSLLHMFPSLPELLQLNATSRLHPLDLPDLALSCRAARDMVYSAHVTKLTFTTSNMQKLPTLATMSERYPAVSHIAIKYTKMDLGLSSEEIQHASECLRCLIDQNSEQTMRCITQLDLILIDSATCRNLFRELSGLLRMCSSMQRLVVRYLLPLKSLKSGEHVLHVVLNLVEQVPGRGLQHHSDLLDYGGDLGQLLGSAACRLEMHQLSAEVNRYRSADAEAADIVCSALPHLSALRDLALPAFSAAHHLQLLAYQYQLTMLTNLELIPSEGLTFSGRDPIRLDLPALRQLTCGRLYLTPFPICFSSRMNSLTRLTLHRIGLQPGNNMQGLQSLQHLTLKYCTIQNPPASLTSDIQALPGLTHLTIDRLLCCISKVDLASLLHLQSVTQLLELSIDCGAATSLPSVPANLTSLHVQACPVSLPATWLFLTHLVRLTLFYPDGGWKWGPIFPVLAQLTTLEHLGMEQSQRVGGGVVMDSSCLDSLTRLTCLKLINFCENVATPRWPLLVQAARLQHLTIACCDCSSLSLPPRLVKLHMISSGHVQLPHALSSCSLLQELRVQSARRDSTFSGISRLSLLTSLQSVMIQCHHHSATTTEAEVATLAALTNLQCLRLRVESGSSLRCLSALKQLTRLELPWSESKELALLRAEGLFPRLRGNTVSM